MGRLTLRANASPRDDANDGPYQTALSPGMESVFRNFLADSSAGPNAHPAFSQFNPDNPKSDYDMRGWFSAAINPNDPMHSRTSMADSSNSAAPHFDDFWKTPYHAGFSDESRFAIPGGGAPGWKEDGYGGWNLVKPSGDVAKAEPDRSLRVHMPGDDQ